MSEEITYSVPIGVKRPGESRIYRNSQSVDGLHKPPENVRSIHDVWRNSVANNGKHKCMEDYTYEQVDQMTQYIGSWLADGGFKLIYIHTINRIEWCLVDIACMKYGIVTVPLYDTLGEEALHHTMNLTGGKLMVESKQAVIALLKANPASLKNITHMILLD
jgi:long-subunit acyl-CoA synthetase (AMP-forming)